MTCTYCRQPTCSGCPSPQEIAERAAEIRAGWSEREHEQRMRSDLRPREWELPQGAGDPELLDC